MDTLSIALVISVGSAVASLVALQSERGAYLVIWNIAFGMAGAALCGLAVEWLAPGFTVFALVSLGPVCAWLAIAGGQAVRRKVAVRLGWRV